MAVTLRLHKPLYEWRLVPLQRHSDLFLRKDIEAWLDDQQVGYRTFTTREDWADNTTRLIFHIKIDDEQVAMLFKLTWF